MAGIRTIESKHNINGTIPKLFKFQNGTSRLLINELSGTWNVDTSESDGGWIRCYVVAVEKGRHYYTSIKKEFPEALHGMCIVFEYLMVIV